MVLPQQFQPALAHDLLDRSGLLGPVVLDDTLPIVVSADGALVVDHFVAVSFLDGGLLVGLGFIDTTLKFLKRRTQVRVLITAVYGRLDAGRQVGYADAASRLVAVLAARSLASGALDLDVAIWDHLTTLMYGLDLQRITLLFGGRPMYAILLLLALIPRSIESGIRAKAVEDWPDDYVMQQFVITEQSKAYNAIPKIRVPSAIRDKVFRKAQKDWPGDYTMQKFVIEEQVKAYNAIR
jgi:hypothetical protein